MFIYSIVYKHTKMFVIIVINRLLVNAVIRQQTNLLHSFCVKIWCICDWGQSNKVSLQAPLFSSISVFLPVDIPWQASQIMNNKQRSLVTTGTIAMAANAGMWKNRIVIIHQQTPETVHTETAQAMVLFY